MPGRKTQHLRRSSLLRQYDFAQEGAYFVTFNAFRSTGLHSQYSPIFFGEVINDDVKLNDYGDVVLNDWQNIPGYFGNADLDAFIIMPNHMHAILIVDSIPEACFTDVIRAFKSFSARHMNQIRKVAGIPVWKRGFEARVIRDAADLAELREMIAMNPVTWDEDEFHEMPVPG